MGVLAAAVLVVQLNREAQEIHLLFLLAKEITAALATEVSLIWQEPVVAAHQQLVQMAYLAEVAMVVMEQHLHYQELQ
jgi:hypothetical protein